MKRTLSLILAIAMLIGLLPGIAFAADAVTTAENPVYSFTVGAISDETIIDVANDTNKTKSVQLKKVTSPSQINESVSSGIWTYYAMPGCYGGALYSGNIQARVDLANIDNNGFVLLTNLKNAGKYDVEVTFTKSTANGRTNIYFVPKAYATSKGWDMAAVAGVNAAIADSAVSGSPVQFAASVDMHQNGTDASPFAGNEIELGAGEHYIILNVKQGAAATSNNRYFTMIKELKLTKKKEATGGTTAKSLKYEFTLAGAGEDVSAITETNGVVNLKRKNVVPGDGNTASEPGDDWTYLDDNGGYYTNTAGPDYLQQWTENGFWGYASSNSYNALGTNGVAFKLNVPASGTYVPKLNVFSCANATTYYAYLIDDAINGKSYTKSNGGSYTFNFESDTLNSIQVFNTMIKPGFAQTFPTEAILAVNSALASQSPIATTPTALTGEALELEAGTYYLFVAQNSASRFYTFINSFELEAQGGSEEEPGLEGDTLNMTYSFVNGGRTDVTSESDLLEKIELTSGAHGEEGATYRTYPNPAYAVYPTDDSVPSNNWAYIGSTFGNGTGRMTATMTFCGQVQLGTYLSVGSNGADEWIAFKFKSPGKTKAKVTALSAYKYKSATADFEAYVVPFEGELKSTLENAGTYGTATTYSVEQKGVMYYYGRKNGAKTFTSLGISEDKIVAKGNCYSATVGLADVELSDNGIFELEDGKEYALIFRAKTKGAATVEKITFTYEVPPLPVLDEIEADFGAVYYGETLKTPDVKWYSNGKEIDGTGGEVSFEIKDDGDGVLLLGKNDKIYASNVGTATVKVSAKLRGVTITKDAEVTVIRDDTYSGANQAYYFYLGAYGEGNYVVNVPNAVSGTLLSKEDFAKSIATSYGEKGRTWSIVAARSTRPDSKFNYLSANTLGIDLGMHEGGWTAFKVKVPVAGKYVVDLSAYSYGNGGLAKLYMLPYDESMDFDTITANINSYTTEENYVGEVDTYSTEKVVKKYPACGQFIASSELDYSEGYAEYLMIVCASKSRIGAETALLLYGIELMGGPSLKSTVTTFDYKTIGVGESVSVTGYTGKNYAGDSVDVKNAYVEYRLAEGSEDILDISEDGKTFTAKREGVATIITYTILDGAIVTEENVITVDDSMTIKHAYIYANGTYNVGEEVQLDVRLEQTDRKVVSGGTIVSYEIVEQDEGVITLSDNNTKATITGAGTAKIKAKIKARGNIYDSDTITIVISALGSYPANFAIDFRTGTYKGDYATSIDGALTYTASRNWIFHDIKGSVTASNMYAFTTDGKYAQFLWDGSALNSGTSYIAFKAQFSTAGKYTVDSVGYCRNRASCMELYLIPVEDDNGTNLTPKLVKGNEYYFGTADHFVPQANAGPDQLKSFGTNEVKAAGEYYVVFKPVKGLAYDGAAGGYGTGDCWYPLYISFENGSSMRSVGLKADVEKIIMGESAQVQVKLYDGAGEEIDYEPDSIKSIIWKSSDENIATVDENGIVTGVSEGIVTISAKVTRDGLTKEGSMDIFVEDTSGINPLFGISLAMDNESIYVYGVTTLRAIASMNSGKEVAVPSEYVTWTIESGEEFIDLDASGRITGKATGTAVVSATVSGDWKLDADTYAIEPIEVTVGWDATVNPQIYTLRERGNALKNAKKYGWVAESVASAKKKADKWLENIDWLYDNVVFEGLPRYYHVGHKYDPKKFFCRYCGCNIGLKYGSYAWALNPLKDEWKIQCPDCKNLFPSNDFKSFYQLGLTDSGAFSIDIALQKHHEMFVCEDVKAGRACSHNPGFPQLPKHNPVTYENDAAYSAEYAAWSKARTSQEWFDYYGYGVEGSFLHNDGFDAIDDPRWGVDDGFGYLQSYVSDPNAIGYDPSYSEGADGLAYYDYNGAKNPVQHTYIAYYIHEGIWYGAGGVANSKLVLNAIDDLRLAFVYTGEAKYGRAGAILLDRVADAYPDFDWYRWGTLRGDNYRGTIADAVWSTGMAKTFATAYDAFLPIYNDPAVSEYLSKRGSKYEKDEYGNWKLDEEGNLIPVNLKDSPGAVRKNAEDNILLMIYRDVVTGKVWGNFGMHQSALAAAAVALNRSPETGEMLSWIIKDGTGYNTGAAKQAPIAGGYVMKNVIEEVGRDGIGNENAPGYNRLWITNLLYLAEMLEDYEGESPINLFENPKFLNMFPAHIRLTLGGYYGAQIGDSGATGSSGLVLEMADSIQGLKYTGSTLLAQGMYKKNGDTAKGLKGSILDDDPEWVEKTIENIIEEYGELALGSDMLTGFGFAALRAGANNKSASEATATNTIRDFAIYYGANTGHGHYDTLNLFMSAFGLNIAPDLGYPEQTGSQPNRMEWVDAAISHNTVVVDEKEQTASGTPGTPYHFDDSGRVKLMDVSANAVYKQCDEYRRSVIMVEVDDETSYAVDFFHVGGGNDHLYSFHSQSDELTAVSGLDDLYVQPMYTDSEGNIYGVYAGPDVKYGPDPNGVSNGKYPHGYTWLRNVRKYNSIDNEFSVEFNVKDWNKKMTQSRDVKLRLTMVSDEPMSEVTFASALPPQTANNKNIGELDYLLVRNKGNDLDTTFTTVLEPYENGKQYVESIEKVSMERAPGVKPGLSDAFSAVKVTLKNGRIDYIIYSNNSEIDYIVDEKIKFRGFAGVMSLENINGEYEVIYSYLNDGEMLALVSDDSAEASIPAYTGTVADFTDSLEMQNSITFTPDAGQQIDANALAGKYVYVANDGVQNGAYKIESAEENDDGDIVLDIGMVSTIRSFVNSSDMSLGYVYNIKSGDSLRIPLPAIDSSAPVFENIENKSVKAESMLSFKVNVESPVGKDITLIGTTLPRGMTIDQETNTISWKPAKSQIGENHVAITADDGAMQTTVHFYVTVYGSTTGAGSGGAGGGGGGAAPAPSKPVEDDKKEEDKKEEDKKEDVPTTPTTPSTPSVEENVRFIDLGAHAWAADAINALAEDGIIKGTSEKTFSPASNITRADFALLLVRAFELSSDNTENFADVAETDYFAKELAIARNTGIVNGIGDNKYAPRNTITRQDMMTIVYRALTALKIELKTGEVEYADFANVADYAKDAVSALITSGLVNGKNGLIDPTANTTRAEVAVLIKRIIDYIA